MGKEKIIFEPEEITKIRTRQLEINQFQSISLNLLAEDSTWEDESFIQQNP